MKKFAVLFLSAALLLSLSLSVFAAQVPDTDRRGSMTFFMDWEGEPLNSGSLTVVRVGEIREDNGDYSFAWIEELSDSGLSLDDLEDSGLHLAVAELVASLELESLSTEIAEGEAVFSDLPTGLYLVTQEAPCEGFAPLRPFLISLPQRDGDAYIYDLNVKPKVSLETKPTEPSKPTEPTEPTEPGEPDLPQTGQLNWPISVLAVSGLAFLTVGCFLRFGKKERHEK